MDLWSQVPISIRQRVIVPVELLKAQARYHLSNEIYSSGGTHSDVSMNRTCV